MKIRNKFRFRLRTLLALMACVCLACGYYAWNAKHYAAVAKLIRGRNTIQWKRESPTWIDEILGIYRFDSVKRIEIHNPLIEFQCVADLNSLEEFRADELHADLSPLSRHAKTLRVFSMYDYPDASGTFLSQTTNLEEFTANTWTGFDLTSLARNKNLKVSYITNATAGLDCLSTFKELEYLNAPAELSTLKPLRHMTKLEYLNFSGSNVQSLEPIKGLKALKYIEFEECPIPQKEIDEFLKSQPEHVKAYGSSWGIETEHTTP